MVAHVPHEPESWTPKPIPRFAAVWTGRYHELPTEWQNSGAMTQMPNGSLEVLTNRGRVRAALGDYIARDEAGTFYPVKPAIWHAHYQRTEETR